ncbi:hypothetical protein GCM10028785_03750 [Hydrogenophaga soli]
MASGSEGMGTLLAQAQIKAGVTIHSPRHPLWRTGRWGASPWGVGAGRVLAWGMDMLGLR